MRVSIMLVFKRTNDTFTRVQRCASNTSKPIERNPEKRRDFAVRRGRVESGVNLFLPSIVRKIDPDPPIRVPGRSIWLACLDLDTWRLARSYPVSRAFRKARLCGHGHIVNSRTTVCSLSAAL